MKGKKKKERKIRSTDLTTNRQDYVSFLFQMYIWIIMKLVDLTGFDHRNIKKKKKKKCHY